LVVLNICAAVALIMGVDAILWIGRSFWHPFADSLDAALAKTPLWAMAMGMIRNEVKALAEHFMAGRWPIRM
jgi:hypothetical protein